MIHCATMRFYECSLVIQLINYFWCKYYSVLLRITWWKYCQTKLLKHHHPRHLHWLLVVSQNSYLYMVDHRKHQTRFHHTEPNKFTHEQSCWSQRWRVPLSQFADILPHLLNVLLSLLVHHTEPNKFTHEHRHGCSQYYRTPHKLSRCAIPSQLYLLSIIVYYVALCRK